MTKFYTFHVMTPLPNPSMNRDANGAPKSQFDGGVQRGRISSQALKRAARVLFRDGDAVGSSRSRYAPEEVVAIAEKYAADNGLDLDVKEAKKIATAIVKSLSAGDATDDKKPTAKKGAVEEDVSKRVVAFFSTAELTSLAHAIVNAQNEGDQIVPNKDGVKEFTEKSFIKDSASPSLDVAAFGRMFANRADLSTMAAVAVSHAVTTHKMALTADYFTAAEELGHHAPENSAGAAHLDLSLFTSGVYYRTFTVDAAQLKRSWSGHGEPGSNEAVAALLKALVIGLPSGKVNSTNAHTLPFLVIAEEQSCRSAYSFETPVQPLAEGGFEQPTVEHLAAQQKRAHEFSPDNFGDVFIVGDVKGVDFIGEKVASIESLADTVAERILNR